MRTSSTVTTPNGIEWYYEQEGTGPDVVLVPDGLGDCHLFSQAVPLIASRGFRVTTFDMPGLSRSATAPPETYTAVTADKLASYVASIMDALDIRDAAVWGCSSGASAAVALLLSRSDLVRCAMAHEMPFALHESMANVTQLDDDELAETLAGAMAHLSGDAAAWEAMGPEVHARLRKNYPVFARGYTPTIPQSAPVKDIEALRGKPLDWSVGADTPTAVFLDNIVTATQAGIPVRTIPGMHFPYVTRPEAFAEYVVETARKYSVNMGMQGITEAWLRR